MPRIAAQFLAGTLLTMVLAPRFVPAQSSPVPSAKPPAAASPGSSAPATIRAVRVSPSKDGTAVEILSSHPLVPAITKVEGPPRLVIDLPNARLALTRKHVDFRNDEISGVRADQFQTSPLITRVVVDLLKPVSYTWDAAGNLLTIRLYPSTEATAQPPSVPALGGGPPAAVPVSSSGSGVVVLAGRRLATGSSITAGSDAAILRLGRGGEVRVCPGTTVSVTSAENGSNLMLGMSTGALEADYLLNASADSILTPDFRILLAGPGEFHYAISADMRGNTCIRALPGNSASVIVSELLGDGTYQVKSTEEVVFHSGRLSTMDSAIPANCGCPASKVPAMLASGPTRQDDSLPARLAQPGGNPARESKPAADASLPATGEAAPETTPLPPPHPNDVHVQVEAPFVFRASDLPPAQPAAVADASFVTVASLFRPAPLEAVVLPPPPPAPVSQPLHHGFFGKVKSFFASVFR